MDRRWIEDSINKIFNGLAVLLIDRDLWKNNFFYRVPILLELSLFYWIMRCIGNNYVHKWFVDLTFMLTFFIWDFSFYLTIVWVSHIILTVVYFGLFGQFSHKFLSLNQINKVGSHLHQSFVHMNVFILTRIILIQSIHPCNCYNT